MKNFIYLMQGTANNVKKYLHLKNRDNCDAIFLTYDKKLNDCEFLPNSTWSEGRNYLLKLSQKNGEYLYTIFCDDDVEFRKGNWDIFEKQLINIKPKIGTPIVPKTRKQTISWLPYQNISVNDEQMMAYHMSVIKDNTIFPLVEEFDYIHWWASCEIQENLIQHYYPCDLIQFNNIEIDNLVTQSYANKMNYDIDFRPYVKDYLSLQNIPYSIKYIKTINYIYVFSRILIRTLKFKLNKTS